LAGINVRFFVAFAWTSLLAPCFAPSIPFRQSFNGQPIFAAPRPYAQFFPPLLSELRWSILAFATVPTRPGPVEPPLCLSQTFRPAPLFFSSRMFIWFSPLIGQTPWFRCLHRRSYGFPPGVQLRASLFILRGSPYNGFPERVRWLALLNFP